MTAKDILKASTLITKSSHLTVKCALALMLILSKVDKGLQLNEAKSMLAKATWMDAKKYLQNAQEVYEHMKGLKVVIANSGHIGRKICSKAEELVQNSEDEVVPREIRSI